MIFYLKPKMDIGQVYPWWWAQDGQFY